METIWATMLPASRPRISRRRFLQWCAALLAGIFAAGCRRDTSQETAAHPTLAPSPTGLWAGASALTITPDLATGEKVWLAGFDNNRPATGVHDDLWVRALALSDGAATWVLAACDLIGLARADVLATAKLLAECGHLPDGLIVCCSHTHSGPDTLGLWGCNYVSSGINKRYQRRVEQQIAAAVEAALADLRPARVRAAVGEVQGWMRNSRHPGVLDTAFPCLVAESPEGEPIATLVNIGCHPEVLWSQNQLITSDFPHYLRAKLEADGWGTAIYTSADLGGLVTPQVPEHTFAQAQAMGEDLAEQTESILRDAPVIHGEFRHASQVFTVPLDNPLFQAARLLGLIRPQIARGVRPTSAETVATLTTLGPIAILGCPGEVSPDLGKELRRMLPGEIPFLIGLANDELGYIIPEVDFRRPANYLDPGKSYVESMSMGPKTGTLLQAAVRDLVQRWVQGPCTGKTAGEG